MKSVKYRWNPEKKVWWAKRNEATSQMAAKICSGFPKKISTDFLVEKIKQHKSICWYPSAGSDLRPLLYLSKPYYDINDKLSGENAPIPDLFILTDYREAGFFDYSANDRRGYGVAPGYNELCRHEEFDEMWEKILERGDILFEDHATRIEIKAVNRFKLELPPKMDLIYEYAISKYYGHCYIMTVVVDSNHNKKLGVWETDIMYICAENTAFAKKILLQNEVNIDYIVRIRYGGSFGFSNGSFGGWLFNLAKPLNVKYYISAPNFDGGLGEQSERNALEYLREGCSFDFDAAKLNQIYDCEWYKGEHVGWLKVE